MKDLLEAGVHFGHQTKRWNPKMKEFIFGERNGIYILDLGKTVKLFREAEAFISGLAAEGRTILFVGTKRQAKDVIAEEAQRCGMFYVNERWLGGLLTNFSTIQRSLGRLRLHQDDRGVEAPPAHLRCARESVHPRDRLGAPGQAKAALANRLDVPKADRKPSSPAAVCATANVTWRWPGACT